MLSSILIITGSIFIVLITKYYFSDQNIKSIYSNKPIVLRKEKGYIKTRIGSLPGGYHKSLVDLQPAEVIQTLNNINIQSE